ncbi:MAG: hypothetical protein OXE17_01120 [Chloroflexi bacterium]|nr:hypothetical protein [Chloroflexota bacterium]
MEWAITKSDLSHDDKSGVVRFVERMERELRNGGTPIEGFQFLNSPLEMLRFSREIEEEILANPDGADLYVGFQNSDKLAGERIRYRQIVDAGVRLTGFGVGAAPDFLQGAHARWASLKPDRRLLVNQWFLVSSNPVPIAFVGWETSPEDRFGKGGITGEGKGFEGFVTADPRVITALVEYLDHVFEGANKPGDDVADPPCELPECLLTEVEDDAVPVMMGRDHSSLVLDAPVRRILAITDLHGSPEFNGLRGWATELAIANASQLVLYEMSAASYLVSPYPEDHRKQWQRILSWRDLLPLGRAPLARQLARIQARGVDTGAILPSTHGFRHLADWANREDIDLILLPVSLVRPGLLARLRGYSLDSLLQHTNRRVMVVTDSGMMCAANGKEPSVVPDSSVTIADGRAAWAAGF